ncbi:hypothetical protein SDC49_02890 [Lactobacillus sp. R2/2]|nr:hypothetical protein [Lactobacillus sp. R2/2]
MGIMEADYVLTGKIFTAAQKHKYVEAVAVKDGKFVYVGSKDGAKSYIGPKTEYIVNNNGLFIPGMTDSHMHFSSGATEGMYKIQLAGGKSVDDYTKIIKNTLMNIQIVIITWVLAGKMLLLPKDPTNHGLMLHAAISRYYCNQLTDTLI